MGSRGLHGAEGAEMCSEKLSLFKALHRRVEESCPSEGGGGQDVRVGGCKSLLCCPGSPDSFPSCLSMSVSV